MENQKDNIKSDSAAFERKAGRGIMIGTAFLMTAAVMFNPAPKDFFNQAKPDSKTNRTMPISVKENPNPTSSISFNKLLDQKSVVTGSYVAAKSKAPAPAVE